MNATRLDDKGVIEICPECGQKNRVSFSHLGNAARCGKVDFWAEWCGPCKMMAPEVKRIAISNTERFIVAKVNTEGLPTLAQRFKINAIPTLVVFSRGVELARSEGALPSVQIQRFVDQSVRAA